MGEDEPEITWDLRVALEWGEWIPANGDKPRVRLARNEREAYPFESLDSKGGVWRLASPGLRPWTRYRAPTSKPAPATLGDVIMAFAVNKATHCKRGTGQALRVAELRVTMLGKPDLEATDWLVSTDGGETWASPNGTVDE